MVKVIAKIIQTRKIVKLPLLVRLVCPANISAETVNASRNHLNVIRIQIVWMVPMKSVALHQLWLSLHHHLSIYSRAILSISRVVLSAYQYRWSSGVWIGVMCRRSAARPVTTASACWPAMVSRYAIPEHTHAKLSTRWARTSWHRTQFWV